MGKISGDKRALWKSRVVGNFSCCLWENKRERERGNEWRIGENLNHDRRFVGKMIVNWHICTYEMGSSL